MMLNDSFGVIKKIQNAEFVRVKVTRKNVFIHPEYFNFISSRSYRSRNRRRKIRVKILKLKLSYIDSLQCYLNQCNGVNKYV